MIRTEKDVPKRARNSINANIERLIKKYGEKAVRMVVMRMFVGKAKKRALEGDIAKKEKELATLRRKT